MSLIKTKKRKKYSRAHGRGMGTGGHGCRKNDKGSGHKGGMGMSGSGKRADQKKTLVNKLYGNNYFGKQGITSKGTERDKRQRIDLNKIILNLDNYLKRGIAKKTKDGIEINLEKYKILGSANVLEKLIIKAKEASKGAAGCIEKVGGKILVESKASV